ncbi:hypothetical protein L3X38_027868 [Prunus dulcis]|uniref:Transposable element protein n=3 Tax=Prunus dulcis TaxID=3755 RepID=A0AAD4VR01_PRUDU|nr:hypothetical protein L3X38_027868 [Prunus dulcis]
MSILTVSNLATGAKVSLSQPLVSVYNLWLQALLCAFEWSHQEKEILSVKMVSQHQSKDSGSKKNEEPTNQTTISDDSKTGRGMSTMPRAVKRKLQKLRPIVEYNKRGKGIGQAHSEMQSYIGVLARSRVPLVDKKWSEIPKDIKEQIWEAVDMAFVKWKDFKSTLTRHYILPYTNDKEKLSQPPETYKFIEKAQWDAFVASRLGRNSSTIIDCLEKEDQLEETMPGVEIDRSTLWKRARQDKHGNIPDPKVAEKAKIIDELQKQVSEGKVSVYGSNDVLTMALGPEHPGREEEKKDTAKNGKHQEDEEKEEEKKEEEKEEEKKEEEKEEEKEKEDEEKHDDKVIEVGDYLNVEAPSSLKTLCRYVETTLMPEEKILQFTIDKEVFGRERDTFLLPEDITQFVGMEEIGATVDAVYMRYLHDVLKQANMTSMVGFIDPATVSANSGTIADRSRLVAGRLQKTDGEPIFMMPYNPGDHVYFNGIDQSYKNWTFHGEPWEATTNASRNVEEDDGHSRYSFVYEEIDMDDNDFGDFGSDPYEFANVIGDGDQPVYPGCRKYTKLSALVKLYNLKAKHGMSDVCFTELLILQGDLLPEGNTIPTSMYEAKKTLCALGLSYEKMHACPNDCILYRKEYEDSTNCPTCGISRWKEGKNSILKDGVPAKVVWYFPPIPRFKRMFQSHETAKSLTWHAARKSIDGQMSHPADSPSWKLLDDKWPEFGNEPRHLRLALSSDGFNPHSSLSSRYSCWPVILVTYNLPPWLCMKRKFMMLTLLISGPKQPGNDIDVYLEPLIDDLKSLWVGIRGVYDAHNGEYFTLRAALMWTINDFPAYETYLVVLLKDIKLVQYAAMIHLVTAFNGKPEYGIPPEPLTGEEVLHMVENGDRVCWKKKSIFFDLEYWKYLPVRHALDVMHIEKNVCDSIIGTLLEIPGKNKDGIAARLDLLNMGVKTDLQPEYGEKRTRLPPGPWNLSRVEKREVCNSFYGMKVPEGYSSNIKNLVSLQDSRLLGLKSHDCRTLMQQLLPVAIRSVLEKPARYAITRLCFFFNAICAKTVDVSKLDKLEEDVVVTLCLLEKYFPPSFFDIMVHLVVHLVREVRLCGPVYFRWMYPFERYMKVLKGYVQNRTRPEGCIAERYIAEEAVEFCTQHLSDVSTVGVPSSQKMGVSKPLSGCTNTEEVLPYIEQHMIHIRTAYPKFRKRTKWLQDKHNSTFIQWLRFKVQSELEEDNHGVSENLRWLAAGPNMAVPLYRSYLIKGIKFNIKAQDDVRTTQNSGVYLLAHTMQVASAKDKNPILSNMGFYGVIQEIWDLDYQKFTIPVFRCDWIDSSGLVVDELGFTLVDLSKIGHRNDQFVLASQVKQIFFVDDPMHRGWSVVLSMPNREYNDVIGDEVLGDVIIECEPFTRGMPNVDTFDELVGELGGQNIRGGCEDIWIE